MSDWGRLPRNKPPIGSPYNLWAQAQQPERARDHQAGFARLVKLLRDRSVRLRMSRFHRDESNDDLVNGFFSPASRPITCSR